MAGSAGPGSADGPVWVVLPTYDEVDNVGDVVARLRRELTAAGEAGHRILIVDDSSPDGTGVVADALSAAFDDVAVLHRTVKDGLGAAYAAGFDRALASGAALVVQMDADASHDPADVPRLVAAARAGADVVLGSRYVAGGRIEGWSLPRRALSRFGSWYARRALAVEVRDLTGGFKCFTRAALERIPYAGGRAQGYAFQVEVTYRAVAAGQTVVELPIVFRERRHGRSKMTPAIALEAAWTVPRLRRRLPPAR
jgi:dolichol-phosphate mannosyltransferase